MSRRLERHCTLLHTKWRRAGYLSIVVSLVRVNAYEHCAGNALLSGRAPGLNAAAVTSPTVPTKPVTPPGRSPQVTLHDVMAIKHDIMTAELVPD